MIQFKIPVIAAKYAPYVVAASMTAFGFNGVEPWISGQIHAESSWSRMAHSYKDGKPLAHGIAQFIPGTYSWADETICSDSPGGDGLSPHLKAHSVEWSVHCMAEYNKYLYQFFRPYAANNCTGMLMSVAAYNMGQGGLLRVLQKANIGKTQRATWFGGIDQLKIPTETRNHVRKVFLYARMYFSESQYDYSPCFTGNQTKEYLKPYE